jgi:hypothetical protein
MVTTDLPRLQQLTAERSRVLGADPARKRLLDKIMTATTREQIGAAIQAQLDWLRANPDDFGVLQAGEDLAYAFEALCLNLLIAMGYDFLPPTGEPGEDSLMRQKGGAPDQRIAVDCIWTYRPAKVNALHRLVVMMRDLRATEGLLVTGAGLTHEALRVAQQLGIRVVDGDELKRLLRTYAPELNSQTEPFQNGTDSVSSVRTEPGVSAESR